MRPSSRPRSRPCSGSVGSRTSSSSIASTAAGHRGGRAGPSGGCAALARGSGGDRSGGACPRGADPVADRPTDERLTVVRAEAPATVDWVEQHPVRAADDEMARKPDPDQWQADPPRRLDLDDREADRQSDPSFEHPVEQAVFRVAVLGSGWSAKPDLAVEDVVEPLAPRRRPGRRRRSGS